MFTERSGKQNKLERVILEKLVPQDHLLRKIDKAILVLLYHITPDFSSTILNPTPQSPHPNPFQTNAHKYHK